MKKVSVTPDLHGQEKDLAAWSVHLQIVKDFKSDIHIIMGDWGEFESVSQHPRSKVDIPRLGEEYAIGNKDLDRLELVLPESCEKHFLEGNHETRITRYINQKTRELAGGVKTVPEALRLPERGWKWHPYGKLLKVGKARFTHGHYLNKYHAEKHVNSFGDSVFYGDTHQFQAYTQTHGTTPHIGMSVGCLRKLDPDWLNGKPNNWVHGTLFLYVLDNGDFIHHFLPIVNGQTVFNGKLYKA